MNNHFTIIIPSYNNEKWAKKCLGSALQQEYNNFDVVYINDCSTDSTVDVVSQVVAQTKTKASVQIVNNDVNRKALYNLWEQINKAKDRTIVVTLDGDDWFPNNQVLEKLDKVYSD